MPTLPDVPGYTLREVIGQGGFAAVYLATQTAVGRDVAVKIDNRLVTGERDQRRFFREVNSAGRLSDHPHVVGLYDAGTLPDGRPYLVMELCSGGSLAGLLERNGPLPPDQVRDLGVRIADALGAAHDLGVLHRDIKPGNILINRYGTVGLADFGLASILAPDNEQSATREALTPAFAAPEAFALAEPAAPADVYSLGATLYALLAGRPPRFPEVGSPSIPTILRLHDEPIPVLPGVPTPLMDVLLRALDSDPAQRYPDGSALRDALAQVPAEDGTGYPSARPLGPQVVAGASAGSSSWASSGPVRWAVAAALVIAVALGTVWALHPFGDDRTAAGPGPGPADRVSAPDPALNVAGVDFGVTTTATGCAAVGSDGTGGRCTEEAECWGGMVVIVGKVEVTRLPCEDEHRWETFAIAPLPGDALTSNQRTLAAHPTVKKLCSKAVMLKSRRGDATRFRAARWAVDVLPPSENAYAEGARVYRCVAALTGTDGTRGSAFTSP